ncbi:glycosyltransferase, partial [Gluconobacter japonicus]|uniref:glycosyltransferase n=1 Tax=Gluconobacter japonicus TaxID=376620 RepID=UPI000793EF11
MTETSSQKDISVIVPCYNEEEVLSIFHQRLSAVMQKIGMSWEVVYVNDGSRDQTLTAMNVLANCDKHVSLMTVIRGV